MEGGQVDGIVFTDFKKQIRPEQTVRCIPGFSREVKLCGKDRAVRRLQADVIVTGPARIKAWYHRFQHVPALGIGELMPSAAEPGKIVLAR